MRSRAAVWLAILLWAACGRDASLPFPADAEARITVRGESVWAEIVRSREEQRLGLSGRGGLAWDRGMLFVYDEAHFPAFWMKDMRFDIDIVWIRASRIVDIHHRVPHAVEPPLPLYQPREAVDRVLELPAGAAQARGWRPGDPVEIVLRP